MSLLSRFVIAHFPRSKHLFISWLQSPSVVILEPKKTESVTVFIFPHLFAMNISMEIKPVNPKEINREYSLEGLMLKPQYFGHLMGRADSLEKTLTLGKTEGRRRRG